MGIVGNRNRSAKQKSLEACLERIKTLSFIDLSRIKVQK